MPPSLSKSQPRAEPQDLDPARLRPSWVLSALGVLVFSMLVGVMVGAVTIDPVAIVLELIDHIPGVDVDSGLSPTRAAIVWDIRFPRVVLGAMVGGMLATSGAAYQGVFRNPLADPYLLGIAAGAGLGATLVIVADVGDGVGFLDPIPLAAFAGAGLAVALTLTVGGTVTGRGTAATLLLAGIAVAAFFTALQTYVQSREVERLREVYSWILGRLSGASWDDVALLAPYMFLSVGVLFWSRRALDVLAVGEDEALTLGIDPVRLRWRIVLAASLAAASAVAVSGLIGFVGIIVPHFVRLFVGTSNKVVIPISFLIGGAFLVIADVIARTIQSPAELPIGVVTAFFGAPFFLFVLRTRDAGVGV
ncbi:MAG: FecCD family ABC transporter permease [Acidimicrobiales bacterium]